MPVWLPNGLRPKVIYLHLSPVDKALLNRVKSKQGVHFLKGLPSMTDIPPLFSTLIQAAQLEALYHAKSHIAIFDCRAKLGAPGWGPQAFDKGHLPAAQFLDLDLDLADPPGAQGRHPLPDIARWHARVRTLGVTNETQVIVYDDAQGAFAARAWWMFRWLGHEAVAVLDGGMPAWSGQLTKDLVAPCPSDFERQPPLTRSIDTTTLQEMLEQADQPSHHLIDARSQARFAGLEEPIDPVAGHIPGALCLPFQDNLNSAGRWLAAPTLAARFNHLEDPVICYCGSGVTACHNILALKIAGRAEPILYPESWSGWITDPDRMIATQ